MGYLLLTIFFPFRSFELGGEKKTKGAALTFVSLLNVLQLSLHAEWLPSTFSEHPMHYARLTFCSSTSPTKYDMHTQFKNLFRPSKLLVNLCPAPPMETLIHISWLSTFYVRIEYELFVSIARPTARAWASATRYHRDNLLLDPAPIVSRWV